MVQKLDNPLVTVYIPTYNRVELLKRAVKSVQVQDYTNLEIIIVDDCSKDDTRNYLEKLAQEDKRIRYFVKEKNSGACVSRNIAIESAKGELITGLDDDDYLHKSHIKNMLNVFFNHMHQEKLMAVYSKVEVVNKGVKEGGINQKNTKVLLADLLLSNCVGNQVLAKKDVYIACGLFDQHLQLWQDYDLWIRMAIEGVVFVPVRGCATYYYDVSDQNGRVSSKGESVIFSVYNRCSEKYKKQVSNKDLNGLLLNVYKYPQVQMSLKDVFKMFYGRFIIMAFLVFLKKKMRRGL